MAARRVKKKDSPTEPQLGSRKGLSGLPSEMTFEPSAEDEGIVSIRVGYGEETYSPVAYNSMRIGGHSVELRPKPGESAKECFERGMKMLSELTEKEFDHRLKTFGRRFSESKE